MELPSQKQIEMKIALNCVVLCVTCFDIAILMVWMLHLFGYIKK